MATKSVAKEADDILLASDMIHLGARLQVLQAETSLSRIALQLIARLPANVELDDLMQAGMMGLLDAVRRYEPTAKAQFETYATTRIRGAMLDELRSQDWLPRSVRSKTKKIETAIQQLNHQLLRAATEGEIAAELGLSLDDYHTLLDASHGMQVVHYEDLSVRYDDPAGDSGLSQLQSQEQCEWANPINQLMSQGLREALVNAIKDLPEREQLLLSLQFEQDLNQKEIGVVMGISEGRVSQLRTQAVARIRAFLAENAWDITPHEHEYQNLL